MSLVRSKLGGAGGSGWYPQVFGAGGGSQVMRQQQFVSVEQLLNDVPATSLLNPHVNRLVRKEKVGIYLPKCLCAKNNF